MTDIMAFWHTTVRPPSTMSKRQGEDGGGISGARGLCSHRLFVFNKTFKSVDFGAF